MTVVSVVIPSYNRARDLERALASVVEQTFRDFEVIVVDNHSTDDTEAVVQGFGDPRVSFVRAHNDGIVAKSRNLGVQRARGEYVAFLDSDDWWTPDKLERSLVPLQAGADVVFHHLYLVTSARQRFFLRRVRARDVRSPVFHDLLFNESALPQSSVVMRRSVLLAIGGMPEDRDLVATEDYVCWLNAARLTERFVRIPGTHGYYWAGGGNISNDARTLRLLDTLEARFERELHLNGRRLVPAWMSYTRGRVHYRAGNYTLAEQHLRLVRRPSAPMDTFARTVVTRAAIALRRLGRSAGG